MRARSLMKDIPAILVSLGSFYYAFSKKSNLAARKPTLICVLAACFCLLVITPCRAQITNVTDDQARPVPGSGHDYIHYLSETVNPANGSVSLRIQPPMAPGRKLTIPFSFGYDSSGIHHLFDLGNGNAGWIAGGTYPASRGWSYILPSLAFQYLEKSTTVGQPPETTTYTCHFTTDYVFQDGNGTPHALGLAQAESGTTCDNVVGKPYSVTDGGDLMMKAHTTNWAPDTSWPPLPVTVADPDGTVYYFQYSTNQAGTTWLPDYIEDRNGNTITVQNSGNGSFTFTDTAGRTLFHEGSFAQYASETVTVSNRSYVVNWNLNPPQYSYSVQPKKIQTSGNCNAPTPVSGSEKIITSIELPNGKSFSFSYDPTYGLINYVFYPSGGFVKYTWGLNANSEYGAFANSQGVSRACQYDYGTPVVKERDVSFDGSTNYAIVQTFTYNTTWSSTDPTQWTDKKTIVHTVDNRSGLTSDTTYDYSPMSTMLPPNEPGYMVTAVPGNYTASTTSSNGSSVVTKHFSDLFSPIYESIQKDGLTAVTTLSYAAGDQVKEKDEYDYSGTLLRKTSITYASFPATPTYPTAPSILDRPSSIMVSGNSQTETDYSYDQSGVSGALAIQHDDTNYGAGSGAPRGNATTRTEGSSVTTYAYDDTGQVVSMTDPCGHAACTDMTGGSHTTAYSYADDYVGGSQPPGQTNAFLTQITYPNTGTAHTERFAYYYTDGQLASSTDQNGQTTNYSYDSMERLESASYPDGGLTTYTYIDGSPTSTMTMTRKISSSLSYVTTSTFDGMGHVTRVALTSDPDGTDLTDTTYDGEGRALCVSNPYRGSSSGNTCYTYDVLGRVTRVTYPDSNTSTTTYGAMSGLDCGTIVDPAARSNEVCSDALGRIMQVTDGLGNMTSYGYDVTDDLTSVSQGSQSRVYSYNSLSQLTSASNPEASGPTTYTYDANGNVTSRTDARSITTTYSYDALNRLLSKTYSDGTPPVNFSYDQGSVTIGNWTSPALLYPTGRMTSATTTANGTTQTALVYSYDQMGRVANLWQCAPYNCGSASIWTMPYTYDLTGDVTNYGNSAGFNVTRTINAAQRVTSQTYGTNMAVSSITYTPWGAISTMCGGQGCAQSQETRQYNSRLQPVLMELGNSSNPTADYCLVYNYYTNVANPTGCAPPSQGTGDNGNIVGKYYQANADTGYSHAAAYTYDGVNRLSTAVATGSLAYNLTYTYDQYGNGTCVLNGSTAGYCGQFTYNANNQISNSGYTYDAAGNLLSDQYETYQYDAEGRVKSSTCISGCGSQYPTYNALGQRVQDYQSDYLGGYMTLTYPRDIFGDRTGIWDDRPSQNWLGWDIFWARVAGQRLNMGGASAYIDHADAIGSTTMETDPSGAVVWDIAYYPWGQVLAQGGTRQSVVWAGLDWQVNDPLMPSATREYSDGLGRWMTPDPGGVKVVKLDDPQTWNMYAYVGDNPTSRIDPSGLYTANCSEDVKNCTKQINNFNNSLLRALKSKNASIREAAAAYGTLGEKNGVNVTFAKVVDPKHANVIGLTVPQAGTGGLTYSAGNNAFQQATQVTLKAGLGGETLEETAVHEGVHVEDRNAFVGSLSFNPITRSVTQNSSLNITGRHSEIDAFTLENAFRASVGLPPLDIQDILAHPPYSDNPTIDMPLFPLLPGEQ